MLIGNALTALNFLCSLTGSRTAYSVLNHPEWAIPPLGFLGIVNFVCLIAIWKWKRWGMYGFAASAAVTFIINAISLSIFLALFALIGVVLIGFLVRPVWNQMD